MGVLYKPEDLTLLWVGGWVIKAYRVAGRGSCLEFGNRVIACPTRIFVVMPHGGAD